jgi:hypothetical protein
VPLAPWFALLDVDVDRLVGNGGGETVAGVARVSP